MVEVVLFSKEDCHLCTVALRMARRIQADLSFRLLHVNITQDAELMQRYGTRIPVIVIDQAEQLTGKITERELRAAIKRARWRGPISRILSRFR